MALTIAKAGLHFAAAFAAIVVLGAAAPGDDAPIAPLAPSAYEADAPAPKTVTVQNAGYQSAPIPDQDADAPADTTNPTASVGPKFLSTKSLFQGDGYNYASSEQSSLDGRRAGAAGLGLNVPVK